MLYFYRVISEKHINISFLDFFLQDFFQCVGVPIKLFFILSANFIGAFVVIRFIIYNYNSVLIFKEAIDNTFVDYCSGIYESSDAALADMEAKLNEIL